MAHHFPSFLSADHDSLAMEASRRLRREASGAAKPLPALFVLALLQACRFPQVAPVTVTTRRYGD
jgi:hypothetical protein